MVKVLYLAGIVFAVIIFTAYLSQRPWIRRRFGFRPPYRKEIRLLKDAVKSGSLDPAARLESVDIDNLLGSDSIFQVEILLGAEELGRKLETVDDMIRLLEAMNEKYEDEFPK